MNILYFDMPMGISGDMVLGAMVDLGADIALLTAALDSLGLSDKYTIRFGRRNTYGIDCSDVDIETVHEHEHRSFGDIKGIIAASALSDRAKATAISVFGRLAAAEGKVHGKAPEEVHFHEVGAIDSIIDICGFAVCRELLHADEIRFGILPAFTGTVRCAHGVIPLPAPAVCQLTRGLLYGGEPRRFELITPTGAAILGEGAQQPVTKGRLLSAGCGSGKKDMGEPNYLRAVLYAAEEGSDRVLEICFETDDMNPELYPHLSQKLLAAGALEVHSAPVIMKKGRPGLAVTVLCPVDKKDETAAIIFANSTTIGLRYAEKERITLDRETVSLSTPWGSVRAKKTVFRGQTANVKPEADDCLRIAKENGIPLKQVYDSLKER